MGTGAEMRWLHISFRFGDLKLLSASPPAGRGTISGKGEMLTMKATPRTTQKMARQAFGLLLEMRERENAHQLLTPSHRISGNAGAGEGCQCRAHHALRSGDAIAEILDRGPHEHLHPNPCMQNPGYPYTSSSTAHIPLPGIEFCRICPWGNRSQAGCPGWLPRTPRAGFKGLPHREGLRAGRATHV